MRRAFLKQVFFRFLVSIFGIGLIGSGTFLLSSHLVYAQTAASVLRSVNTNVNQTLDAASNQSGLAGLAGSLTSAALAPARWGVDIANSIVNGDQTQTLGATAITHPGAAVSAAAGAARAVANGSSVADAASNAADNLQRDANAQDDLFPCDQGQIICSVMRMILNIITGILGLVIQFLGWIVTFAVQILIGFAKYNSFGSASPVISGWVVVRDLVNMFFIVILLVSAFATIIGYESSFHYTKVLPKLLLMAVLINFSKTLLLLLVDFSQVVMLTFVNAFQQASAANFVHALQLDRITQISSGCGDAGAAAAAGAGTAGGGAAAAGATGGGGAPAASGAAATAGSGTPAAGGGLTGSGSISSAAGSSGSGGGGADGPATGSTTPGCSNGSAAVTVTTILLAYMLGIILLVIALGVIVIMIAYIIARIIGLWIILIFSPLAFFCTALPARLQKGMSSFTGEYWSKLSSLLTGGPIIAFFLWLTLATVQGSNMGMPQDGVSAAQGDGGFISPVGNAQVLATFVVAIAMLLMGLDAAVKSASAVSAYAGQFAKNVQGLTTKSAAFVAKSPLYAARSGARAIDRRADITGLASRAALHVPILRDVARKPLMKGLVMRRKEKEAMAQEELAETKNMTRSEKLAVANSMGAHSWNANPHEQVARARILQDLGSDDSRFKQTKSLAADFEKKMKADPAFAGMSEVEIKRGAQERAVRQATEEGGRNLAEAKRMYDAIGDDASKAKSAEIDSMIEKNPALEQDTGKRKKLHEKIRIDDDKRKNVSAEGWANPETALAMLPPGTMRSVGGVIQGFDRAQLASFKEQNKDNKALISTIETITDFVSNSPGGVPEKDIMGAFAQRDAHGENALYDGKTHQRMQSVNERTARAALDTTISSAPNQGRTAPGSGMLTNAAIAANRNALSAGIRIEEVLNNGNEQSDQAVSKGFAQDIGTAFAASSGVTTKAGLDAALAANGAGSILSNLEKPGVTEDIHMRIIEAAHNNGAAATMAATQDFADRRQMDNFAKLLKVAADREVEIGRRGGPRPGNAAEQAVVDFLREARNRMPRRRVPAQPPSAANPAGTPEIPAAVSVYSNILWRSS